MADDTTQQDDQTNPSDDDQAKQDDGIISDDSTFSDDGASDDGSAAFGDASDDEDVTDDLSDVDFDDSDEDSDEEFAEDDDESDSEDLSDVDFSDEDLSELDEISDDEDVEDDGFDDLDDGDDFAAEDGAGDATVTPGGGQARKDAEAKGHKFVAQTKNFDIPDVVYKDYPGIINLILETESMNDEERQYWFQILPIMTDDQIQKFKEILVNEKEQLSKLDQEYETELKSLNDKHMIEWKEFETKEKRRKLQEAEAAEEEKEAAKQEELLKQLEDL